MGNAQIDRVGRVRSGLGFILVLVSRLSSPQSFAAPAEIGGLTVTLPDAGWRKAGKGNLFMLQKEFPETEDDKRGNALIQITKPLAAARNSLQAGMKTFVATLPDMAKEDILIKHYGVSVNGYDIRVEERCCVQQKNVSISQIVVGIAGDKRQAFLQLVLLNVNGDRSSSAEADFAALVRSVKLDSSDKDFDLVPTSGDGGLDGVFTHLDTGLRPNVFGGMDFYSDSTITTSTRRVCSAQSSRRAAGASPNIVRRPRPIAASTSLPAVVFSPPPGRSKCAVSPLPTARSRSRRNRSRKRVRT